MVEALRSFFSLTPQERWFLATVMAIFLVGLAVKYLRLRRLEPVPVPEPVEPVEEDP